MNILHLSLKTKWFKMIESGEKREEYRELKPYWYKRLGKDYYLPGQSKWYRYYDVVEFTLGYPKKDDTSRRMTFEITSIETGKGNPQWGAPTDKSVFIIKLGRRIK